MSVLGVLVFAAWNENFYCLTLHCIVYIVAASVPVSEPDTLHKLIVSVGYMNECIGKEHFNLNSRE